MIEKIDLITLLQLKNVGNKTILRIYDHIKNRRLINLEFQDYITILREKLGKIYSKIEIEKAMLKSEKILEECYLEDIKIHSFLDCNYPDRFNKINYDKPVIFYSLGNYKIMTGGYNLGVIGSRKVSRENYKRGFEYSKDAVKLGINIISGLAQGCDTAGHRGAISVSHWNYAGKTLAVLPSGIKNIYPVQNTYLGNKIIENNGCLISEKTPFEKPKKHDYIQRDRLQAGLSEGVFIIQSGTKSGTVHTANYALKYSKKIFCLGINNKNKGMELNRELIIKNKAYKINSKEEFIKVVTRERDENNETNY
ncbi:MAG: DNA-processing protein DprA [Eubacteriales bacterium]